MIQTCINITDGALLAIQIQKPWNQTRDKETQILPPLVKVLEPLTNSLERSNNSIELYANRNFSDQKQNSTCFKRF